MEKYERALRERVIPFLEKMTDSLQLWERKWEDAFCSGICGDYGLPNGVYEVILVRTGEITIQGIAGLRLTFSVFDDRAKKIYSRLEQLENGKKKKEREHQNPFVFTHLAGTEASGGVKRFWKKICNLDKQTN